MASEKRDLAFWLACIQKPSEKGEATAPAPILAHKRKPLPAEVRSPKTMTGLVISFCSLLNDVMARDTDESEIRDVVGGLIGAAEKSGAFDAFPDLRKDIDGFGCARYMRKLGLWLEGRVRDYKCVDDRGAAGLQSLIDGLSGLVRQLQEGHGTKPLVNSGEGQTGKGHPADRSDDGTTWLTVTEAAKRANVTRSIISGACRGGLRTNRKKGRERRIDEQYLKLWMKAREYRAASRAPSTPITPEPAGPAVSMSSLKIGYCTGCGTSVSLKANGTGECPKCHSHKFGSTPPTNVAQLGVDERANHARYPAKATIPGGFLVAHRTRYPDSCDDAPRC